MSDSKLNYLFPFQLLRIASQINYWDWRKNYKCARQSSYSWDSEAVFVPVSIVIKAINEFGTECKLDVLDFPLFIDYLRENDIPIEYVGDKTNWCEFLKNGVRLKKNNLESTTKKMLYQYKKALNIVGRYIKPEDTSIEKYAFYNIFYSKHLLLTNHCSQFM